MAVMLILVIILLVIGCGFLAWRSSYADAPPRPYDEPYDAGRSDYMGTWLFGHVLPWQADKVYEQTQRWADDNGYRVVSGEYRTFFEGPFFWRSNDRQIVQRITVRDQAGRERSGYLRTGHWLFGLGLEDTVVEWDEPEPREQWRR